MVIRIALCKISVNVFIFPSVFSIWHLCIHFSSRKCQIQCSILHCEAHLYQTNLCMSFLCFCNILLVQTGAADYSWLQPSPSSPQSALIWQLLLWIQSPAIAVLQAPSNRGTWGVVLSSETGLFTQTHTCTLTCSVNIKHWSSLHLGSLVWNLLEEQLIIVLFCQVPYLRGLK